MKVMRFVAHSGVGLSAIESCGDLLAKSSSRWRKLEVDSCFGMTPISGTLKRSHSGGIVPRPFQKTFCPNHEFFADLDTIDTTVFDAMHTGATDLSQHV